PQGPRASRASPWLRRRHAPASAPASPAPRDGRVERGRRGRSPVSDARAEYYREYFRDPLLEESPYQTWKEVVTAAHPLVRGARSVLDVGCGSGATLVAIKRAGFDGRLV